MSSSILVTGATGFVGHAVVNELAKRGRAVLAGVRQGSSDVFFKAAASVETVSLGDLSDEPDFRDVFSSIDTVVHCAARAHVMNERGTDLLSTYRKHNTQATLNLARQAAMAGVRRFVFISTIKVNGEQTSLGLPFTEGDVLAASDPYGFSKLEAEQGLLELAKESTMDVVIIRPVLVYGKGVKGNFATMIRLVNSGIPLPFGQIANKRSLVSLDNLVDLIITCIDHPKAVNQVFLAGDGDDVSTTQLLRQLAQAMGKPSRLVRVPLFVLAMLAAMFGKRAAVQRSLGSLQVDISKSRTVLGWQPTVSLEEGLKRCFESEKQG
jgi:nucleoside-diphosphate-sugar epimerase